MTDSTCESPRFYLQMHSLLKLGSKLSIIFNNDLLTQEYPGREPTHFLSIKISKCPLIYSRFIIHLFHSCGKYSDFQDFNSTLHLQRVERAVLSILAALVRLSALISLL